MYTNNTESSIAVKLQLDQPINGISIARSLIEHYRKSVHSALIREGVSSDQADLILGDYALHSGISSGALNHDIWFTLRRPFAVSDLTLTELARELGLRQSLVDTFSKHPRLYRYQEEAVRAILAGRCTVLATGTGSGKTEAFLIPLIERCLRHGGPGVKAIIVYPMNALAEDQRQRIEDYLGRTGLRVERYTGEEDPALRAQRDRMLHNPPDILVTNHVMLERILTRNRTRPLRGIGSLQTVVFDEVHTFRGNVGADIGWLIRRLRAACNTNPVFVGASATLKSHGRHLADESGAHESALQRYLRDLFAPPDDDVVLIQPSYVDEPLSGGSFPEPRWENLRWPESVADASTISAAFLGRDPEEESDDTWSFVDDGSHRDMDRLGYNAELRDHALIRSWRAFLVERGAATYAELVDEARATYEAHHSRPCPNAEGLAAAALTAITEANAATAQVRREGGSSSTLLDLVTHLVLGKVKGWLLLCLVCGRYTSGYENECRRCGAALFDAIRSDATSVLAEVDWAQRRLVPVRRDGSRWPRLTATVSRLHPMDTTSPDGIRVEVVEGSATSESLQFEESPNGTLQVRPFSTTENPRSHDIFVNASETADGLDHLASISEETLSLSGHAPRLLVFGNDRTSVSVVGYVLREHLADQYLRDLVGRRVNHHTVGLDQVLLEARQGLAESTRTTYHKELEENLAHWFVRLCATPCRSFPRHQGTLAPADPELLATLGPAAEFLVHTCIMEGAISWYELVERPSHQTRHHFEFDHRRRTSRRVLRFTRGAFPASNDVQSIALTGETNSLYEAEVNRFGVAALESAAQLLVDHGVLVHVKDALQDGIPAYALAPAAVTLVRWPAIDQLSEYRAVGIHTSETPRAERHQIERDFSDPATPLSIIVATSTLEMGVDIGALRTVLSLGVPPTPANYAQRAGRAGRSPHAWYALSIIWCDESDPHDRFFLQNTTEMRGLLSGQVLQPEMDIDNPRVVRRHLLAAVLQDCLGNPAQLRHLIQDPLSGRERLPKDLLTQFEQRLSVRDVLRHELAPILKKVVARQSGRRGESEEAWFTSANAPNYGFRQDELSLYLRHEPETGAKRPTAPRLETISRRPPEQAVRSWALGTPVATPRGTMRIQHGYPETPETFQFPDLDQARMTVAQYKGFLVTREEGWVSRGELRSTSMLISHLHATKPERGTEGNIDWLKWWAVSDAQLSVVNRGREIQQGSESQPTPPWGFRTRCDALLVAYDALVLGNVGEVGLASALDHAIQRYIRISDADLLLLQDVEGNLIDPGFRALVLADVSGHGLVPMERLAREFREILQGALDRLRRCDCRNGCFRCLRTYNTSRLAAQISKADTEKVLAAILGEGSWTPPLPPNPHEPQWYGDQVCVDINARGKQVEWSVADHKGTEPIRDGEKPALVQALLVALDHVPDDACVIVRTNKSYFADLIRGKRKSKLDGDESRLVFRLLRFPRVRAESPPRRQQPRNIRG